jgi:hypothetical protein
VAFLKNTFRLDLLTAIGFPPGGSVQTTGGSTKKFAGDVNTSLVKVCQFYFKHFSMPYDEYLMG